MNTYKVEIIETIVYELVIDAKNRDAAEEAAIAVIVDTVDRDVYFKQCDERVATAELEEAKSRAEQEAELRAGC